MTTSIEVHREPETRRLELIAIDKPQLEAAHVQMQEWTRQQIAVMRDELQEAEENLIVAQSQKWETTTYENRARVCRRRIQFYEKIGEAIEAGYVIVPNFPMDVFAIRTAAARPRGGESTSHWHQFQQTAQLLPSGEGEYKNPLPSRLQRTDVEKDSKGAERAVTYTWPDEFVDIAFPVALAKPVLMQKTAEAMGAKLFDEIGVARDQTASRAGDPMILGRMRNPRKGGPSVTFFIGWYLDPSRI